MSERNIRRCRHSKYWIADFRTGVNVQPYMCGPVCCGLEVIAVSLKVVQEWSSWIVRGGINSSSSFATGNIWVWKGRPNGSMNQTALSSWWWVAAGKGTDRNTSVQLERFWGRERLALFHRLWIAWERSGQNGISHPHWVKISDETNGQVNLHAKQKFEVLSATCLKFLR